MLSEAGEAIAYSKQTKMFYRIGFFYKSTFLSLLYFENFCLKPRMAASSEMGTMP